MKLGEHWSVDVSVDGNRTIGAIRAKDVINVDHPVASGGFLGGNGTLTEDFLAISTGATYRADRWTLPGRAEYLDGQLADRYGLTLRALRPLREGPDLGPPFPYATAARSGPTQPLDVSNYSIRSSQLPAASRVSPPKQSK